MGEREHPALLSREKATGDERVRAAVELVAGRAERVAALLERAPERNLLTVAYGGSGPGDRSWPVLAVPNPVLGSGPWLEIWRSTTPVAHGRRGGLVWAENGELLALAVRRGAEVDPAAAARAQFDALLDLVEARGYPHLLRVWNYLPRINQDEAGVERYRSFNLGRLAAFEHRYGAAAERRFSASSAVGTPGTDLLTCALAACRPGAHLENPRQVEAYRYPERYGPRPPSFARGTLAPGPGGAFFLSGTASIVGHETRHPGSTVRQLIETWENIDAVAARAEGSGATRAARHDFDLVKVYLRRLRDLPRVQRGMGRRLPPAVPVLYLLADICRAELRIEIEAVAL